MGTESILVIDETLREGMQYRGLMFSREQRFRILEFQEALGVNVCQAGYPPAHAAEAEIVRDLFEHARNRGFQIRVAAMGRANRRDAEALLATGIRDLHLHLHLPPQTGPEPIEGLLQETVDTIKTVKARKPDAVVSVALLDIGKADPAVLDRCVSFLNAHGADILSLPDTSGMMGPNQVFEAISRYRGTAATLSIHCHNDLGMASANTVLGILAGGRVLEASALGLGERNGIADLFTVLRTLKNQGVHLSVDTDDLRTFRAYYRYVDAVVREQTKESLLTYNTPFFGQGVITHVAGTHAHGRYGPATEADFYLNVLCGKGLVGKYLERHNLSCPADFLGDLTRAVKAESIRLSRRLSLTEVQTLISLIQKNKALQNHS